jgi:hypothetical protein
MTTERRIAADETALTPTELVVVWLIEAHAHGGVDAFVRSSLADENYVPPINRLGHAAAVGVRARLKGKPRIEIDRAADQAVRETLFRFHLVMRINTVCRDILERELLLTALFSTRIALLLREVDDEPGRIHEVEQLRDLVSMSLRNFRAVGATRDEVERRYLAGHPALFPDDAARWVKQLRTSETPEAMVGRLAELDGVPAVIAPPPNAFAARIADFVEPAKVAALEDLDEGRDALGIATSWLRERWLSLTSPPPLSIVIPSASAAPSLSFPSMPAPTPSATADPYAAAQSASQMMRSAITAARGPNGLNGKNAKDLGSQLDQFDQALNKQDPNAAQDAANKLAAQVADLIDRGGVTSQAAAQLQAAANNLVAAANALPD